MSEPGSTDPPAAASPSDLIAVGRVTRPHGIHGFVAVLPLSEVEGRFEPGSRLLFGESSTRRLTVVERRGHPGKPLLRFEGVSDRTGAEELAGQYLFVPESESPDLPPGEYWPHQLVGLKVVTADGRDLGRLREVLQNVANDIWIARTLDGTETLVPALKDVVLEVDLAAGRIVVAEIPGLTVPEA